MGPGLSAGNSAVSTIGAADGSQVTGLKDQVTYCTTLHTDYDDADVEVKSIIYGCSDQRV